jgi:hypothetical protein
MKGVFKTNSLTFHAEFNGTLTSRQLVKFLNISSVVNREKYGFYLIVKSEAVALVNSANIAAGELVYVPSLNRLYIFCQEPDVSLDDLFSGNKWVVVGRTLALPEELQVIGDGEKMEISIDSPEEKSFNSDRKLSQSEIDDLIKSLQSQK